jgi:hypothetical protein
MGRYEGRGSPPIESGVDTSPSSCNIVISRHRSREQRFSSGVTKTFANLAIRAPIGFKWDVLGARPFIDFEVLCFVCQGRHISHELLPLRFISARALLQSSYRFLLNSEQKDIGYVSAICVHRCAAWLTKGPDGL